MKELVSEYFALRAIATLLTVFVGMHGLIVAGAIPYQMVWGGRLTSRGEMLRMESISIALNLLMILLVAIRAGWLKIRLPFVLLSVAFWLMMLLFLLNTLGNLASVNLFEKLALTPITLLLAFWCLRVALSRRPT